MIRFWILDFGLRIGVLLLSAFLLSVFLLEFEYRENFASFATLREIFFEIIYDRFI